MVAFEGQLPGLKAGALTAAEEPVRLTRRVALALEARIALLGAPTRFWAPRPDQSTRYCFLIRLSERTP